MATTKRLYMVFTLSDAKTATISLLSPKSDLDRETIEPVMQSIIDNEALLVREATPTGIKDAYIREVQTTDII